MNEDRAGNTTNYKNLYMQALDIIEAVKRERDLAAKQNEALQTKLDVAVKEKEVAIKERDLAIKELNDYLRNRFKKTSEVISKDQLMLFDEAEMNAMQDALDEEKENGDKETPDKERVRKCVRKKIRNTHLTLPPDIPVKDIYVEPKNTVCTACGATLVDKGEKITERIVRQTSYIVVRTHYRKMECPRCTQPAPLQEDDMLAGSVLDPAFLASVVSAKMRSGVPLYRQEASFGESGISRRLLSANMMRAGEKIAYNLIPLLEQELNKAALINCDETTINVIKLKGDDGRKKGPNSKANAFMVVRVGTYGDGWPGPVVFTYTDNRRNQTIADFIGHYTGCVQTDGLKAYSNAASKSEFVHLECLVHARRKAIEAAEGFKSGKAVDLVRMYANIFHQEGILNDKYPVHDDAFVEERRRVLLPLLQELKKECWGILRGSVTPSKKLKTACNYYIERYDTLIRFLDYPFATSSNQLAEQQIRPFVVGRKGFLFCITELGAEVSAAYYSLVQTCVRMGVDVEDYLTHVFFNGGRLKDGDVELWSGLLPGKADLTEAHNYRLMLKDAKPDVSRSEPYVLRGRKPV